MEVDDVAASHGSDLYWLMQKPRILIKAIYLSQLGISIDIAKNLFERNAYYLYIISLKIRESHNSRLRRMINLGGAHGQLEPTRPIVRRSANIRDVGRPGPIDLVQQQASGHGEIQGVSDTEHRDANEVRAEITLERREPSRSSPRTRIVGRG